MKSYSNRNFPDRSILKKAMPLAACAFFLCLTSAQAQNNEASGDNAAAVYGSTTPNLPTISTLNNGTADLNIQFPSTTALTLNRDVMGYVNISNNFSSFTITANGGSLVATHAPSLSVIGGSNLTVTAGIFGGNTGDLQSNEWARAVGGEFSNVQNLILDGATFAGQRYEISSSGGGPPLPGEAMSPNASGSAGLVLLDGSSAEIAGTTLTGGDAGSATQSGSDTFADGGSGLNLFSSSGVLSNATVTGGAGGNANSSSSYQATADGGHAIYASNSTVVVRSGTYTGGAAGIANRGPQLGGAGLIAVGGSSITNYGGTFTGGNNAPSLLIQNSDLTTFGGTYTGGGLYSQTTGSGTNNLDLMGGTFSSLSFINGTSNGVQFVAVSNISVSVNVYQEGGTVEIDNFDNNAFQNVTLAKNSTMAFKQDFVLSGELTLDSPESTARFQGLEVVDGGTANVGLGSVEITNNATFKTGSTVNFQVLTNQNGTLTAAAVAFETNSTMVVDATLADFSAGGATSTVINTTSGISGFDTNLVNTVVQTSGNTNTVGRTTFSGFNLSGNELALTFNTASLAEYWGATNGPFGGLASELETLVTPEMNIQINNLGADESGARVEQTYFTTLNTFQTAKQGLDAAVGLSLSRGTEFREKLLLPKGTQGPKLEPQNDWRFWLKYYGNFYSKDTDGLNPEYDATLHGGVLGMDKSFGNLLFGISGGAGNYKIDSDYNAEQTMNAFQGAIYSTYGAGHSYLDLGLAYGFNDVTSKTADPFILEGEFDTHLVSAHLGGGIGFELPKIGTVLTPEAAVRYTLYQQEAYTETGTAAVPRSFDEFDSDSLVGIIGLNAAMLNTTSLKTFGFKIDGRAHWMREFNPEPGELNYQLVGGANEYAMIYPFLDEDTIRLGVGFTFFNTGKKAMKNVLLRLDFDELFGKDFNSHNLSAKAIWAF